jgi:type 1 fimbriae regulatory protein FimB/type 1 fimbriae regulatory protein FimE
MPKPRLRLVAPTSVNRTVPRRLKNKDLRTREHLTEKEVERLIKAAGDNRYGQRDASVVQSRLEFSRAQA